MQSLADKCNLRKLSLVQVGLSALNIAGIEDILKEALLLIELDISWNEMKSSQLHGLTKFLAENRQIEILNLSWN